MDLKKLLKTLKLNESVISTILGFAIIIVLGILAINYFAKNEKIVNQNLFVGDEQKLPKKHIVAEGEDLWKISEKYYGTGYNWPQIAKENKIINPDILEKGREILIPNIEEYSPSISEPVEASPTQTIKEPSSTNSPTEAPKKEVETSLSGTYEVKKGNTLWSVSISSYGSGYNWTDIAKANNLKSPYTIEIAQKLIIPKLKVIEKEVTNVEVNSPISSDKYEVIKGDSLWKIAVRAYQDGYKWPFIAKANNLPNPNIITPGQALTLPR